MDATHPVLLLGEITDFLASSPTPQEIVNFKLSEALEQRALDLLTRNRENRLSSEEHLGIEEFRRMEYFMTMLKAKARVKLAGGA